MNVKQLQRALPADGVDAPQAILRVLNGDHRSPTRDPSRHRPDPLRIAHPMLFLPRSRAVDRPAPGPGCPAGPAPDHNGRRLQVAWRPQRGLARPPPPPVCTRLAGWRSPGGVAGRGCPWRTLVVERDELHRGPQPRWRTARVHAGATTRASGVVETITDLPGVSAAHLEWPDQRRTTRTARRPRGRRPPGRHPGADLGCAGPRVC